MWRRCIAVASVLLPLVVLYLAGCSKKNLVGPDGNSPPETELTYAPVESVTTTFRVHLYWYGYDNDGEVIQYRFAIDQDTTKPVTRWKATTAHDSIFTFQVDLGDLIGGHVFWIVAVDNDGAADRTPAKRYFSIRTLPPTSSITRGPDYGQFTSYDITVEWTGSDPDGGPVGNPARPDSFEYIMLWTGRARLEGHPPLPELDRDTYASLLNQAKGSSLLPPYDDWKWTRTAALSHRFTSQPSGVHVYAVRAVDLAGAKDTLLTWHRNIRYFVIPLPRPQPLVPTFSVGGDILPYSVTTNDSTDEGTVVPAETLEGTTPRFTWGAVPGWLGTPIAGYSAALDDTTTTEWSRIDLTNTSRTLTDLTAGTHSLYLRAVDTVGRTTLVIVRITVVQPAFRDPTTPASLLYVDDFAAPTGDWTSAVRGRPNFPPDSTEDAWWRATILVPLAQEFGYTFEQTDPVYLQTVGPTGLRTPPTLEELARHRVVIWSVDLNNTIYSPAGLWNALHWTSRSSLKEYVRAGGTLILTGFMLASNAALVATVPYSSYTNGMCANLEPGGSEWAGTYFLRDYMGIDGALGNDVAQRSSGARDFVGARVTSAGTALGFQSADVDTGASVAKWNPYAYFGTNPDTYLAPGLMKVEGWKLETSLGCNANESVYRRENPSLPIASPIFTYHGVDKGVLQDLGPSPREGLVVGIATQAHDDGQGDGSVVTPGNARGVTGRMVFLGFPIYYMKDAEAYAIMRAAFAYVNGSPTLVGGTP